MAVIEGKRSHIAKELEREMKAAAKAQNFETAAKLRNRLFWLKSLDKQVIFSDKEFLDISKDHALNELVNLLSLTTYPRRIEGYDISHLQGSDVVASMVVFTNGVSDKAEYRKFKTRQNLNNDFYNMNETIKRRFNQQHRNWGLPNLVIIDGGKGQLDAAIKARDEAGFASIPFIGLAKREEQIVIDQTRSGVSLNQASLERLSGFASGSDRFRLINLPPSTNLIKLLQRIRDESHRFAVSYHSVLKQKRQLASGLDEIPGVGPVTRRQLLKHFGSLKNISLADETSLAEVIGKARARAVKSHLG
jgi:excinuclease ABC subunit C